MILKKKIVALGLAGVMACTALSPAMSAQAAEQIVISQSALTIAAGTSQSVLVDYSGVAGGYADLAVAVSNDQMIQAVLADAGNGQAVLTITMLQYGSASVAVCQQSNVAIVSYVTVSSGYAPSGQTITTMNGDQLVTVYDDRIVSYKTTATGRNGEMLAIQGMKIVRSAGIDCLEITGLMLVPDSTNSGMSTFYADFYDASGALIKRQAVYALTPLTYESVYTLDWYIPDGCTQIVIE